MGKTTHTHTHVHVHAQRHKHVPVQCSGFTIGIHIYTPMSWNRYMVQMHWCGTLPKQEAPYMCTPNMPGVAGGQHGGTISTWLQNLRMFDCSTAFSLEPIDLC